MKNYLALSAAIILSAVIISIAAQQLPTSPSQTGDNAANRSQHVLNDKKIAETDEQPPVSTAPASVQAALLNTSLANTEIPAALSLDSQGHLIVDSNSKAVLDYFLSLLGEIPEQQIRDLLQQWATEQAGTIAAMELADLYDRYRSYARQFALGDFSATDNGDIRDQLMRRQRLRDDTLGADHAAALFAEEDQYDNYSLVRHDILASKLTEPEKAQALALLWQTRPEHLARQYHQQYQLQHLENSERDLRESDATAAEYFTLHQQLFGDAAALRLQTLAQQRDAWRKRLDQYHLTRKSIEAAGLAEEDQARQLEAVRHQLFSKEEQLRLAALTRIQSQAP